MPTGRRSSSSRLAEETQRSVPGQAGGRHQEEAEGLVERPRQPSQGLLLHPLLCSPHDCGVLSPLDNPVCAPCFTEPQGPSSPAQDPTSSPALQDGGPHNTPRALDHQPPGPAVSVLHLPIRRCSSPELATGPQRMLAGPAPASAARLSECLCRH